MSKFKIYCLIFSFCILPESTNENKQKEKSLQNFFVMRRGAENLLFHWGDDETCSRERIEQRKNEKKRPTYQARFRISIQNEQNYWREINVFYMRRVTSCDKVGNAFIHFSLQCSALGVHISLIPLFYKWVK